MILVFLKTMSITSFPHISKSKLASYRKLLQKKYREQEGKFLIEGTHLVQEAMASGEKIDAVLMTREFLDGTSGAQLLEGLNLSAVVNEIDVREVESITETVTPQGVVAVVQTRNYTAEKLLRANGGSSVIVALDAVADPGNVGTIIRTCDWFGVDAVLLGRDSVELHNPKVIRATQGSLFHLPIMDNVDLPDTLGELKEHGFTVIGTSLDAKESFSHDSISGKTVIVLGNEGSGLSAGVADACDRLVKIPGFGKAESLNVSVTCGVLLGVARLGRVN